MRARWAGPRSCRPPRTARGRVGGRRTPLAGEFRDRGRGFKVLSLKPQGGDSANSRRAVRILAIHHRPFGEEMPPESLSRIAKTGLRVALATSFLSSVAGRL